MGHLTEATVRRYLDEPVAVSDAERRHLAGCARCDAGVRAAAGDRDVVRRALDDAAPPTADLDDGWARLRARVERGELAEARPPVPLARPALPRRFQVAGAALAAMLVIGGTAAAAATDWLPVFRAETVAPVQVSTRDLRSFPTLSGLNGLRDLARYGDLDLSEARGPYQVPDLATAAERTGLTAPQVRGDLPQGVTGRPQVYLMERQTATFTFSRARAEAAAKDAGALLPPVPPGLDGASLRVEGGPAVAQVWMQGTGMPTLVVARAFAPSVTGQGAPAEQLRDYLLTLPGVPADLAAQLRSVGGDGRTLPIPVLQGEMTSTTTTIDGTEATVLEARGGYGAGVIWVQGETLTVVAGMVDTDEVLRVARGLG